MRWSTGEATVEVGAMGLMSLSSDSEPCGEDNGVERHMSGTGLIFILYCSSYVSLRWLL